ncbi:MAG: replicative DNA helicase [Chlamydiae bacterium RIFCSPHIGHO2_12_FULL_49_11]|nr:MAG: replicative DNA helicase [Chlamydiae bacterium RIFCSPHIGHO2_12_FULL_49_11]
MKKGAKTTLPSRPHAIESEKMVLGCMLSSNKALNIGSESLIARDFFLSKHQMIFDSLYEAYQGDKPADVHLIAEILRRKNQLDDAGGSLYLVETAQFAGTSQYIEEYIEIIRNKAVLREMIDASKEIEKAAYSEPEDVDSILDDAQGRLYQISQRTKQSTGVSIKEVLTGIKSEKKLPYLKELELRQEEFLTRDPNQPATVGLPTGFIDLDRLIGGFNRSNLIILAARPSMGKTALAVNIAEHIAMEAKVPVGMFSLEMTAEELVHRIVSSQSEVESEKIRNGSLSGLEYQRIVSAVSRLQESEIIIDDQPGMKITDLRARARRLKEVYNIQFLVIDYLQLLSGARTFYSAENRQNEISEISRMLKTLARELEIPILCLSQLSRRVEERAGHRPMLSDLRESGSIEQDADIVMFVFRRDYYNPNDKPGMAEIIVAKNRHGGVGDAKLAFRKAFARFHNFAKPPSDEEPANDSAFSHFDAG